MAARKSPDYRQRSVTPDGTRLIARSADSRGFYVWDLRLIRGQLQQLGMDWELPEFAPNFFPTVPAPDSATPASMLGNNGDIIAVQLPPGTGFA